MKENTRHSWSGIEHKIALYVYLYSPKNIKKNDDYLKEICERLYCYTGNEMPIGSIYAKLQNYKYCDPNEKGGLKGNYKKHIVYWNQYASNPSALQKIYNNFIESTNNYKEMKKIIQNRNDFDKFQEEIKEEMKTVSPEKKDAFFESIINIRNPQFQQTFKHNLKVEFNNKCVICGLNIYGILIASHIIAYSNCNDKYDMINHNNGLLLCPNHDSLFDKHLISFDNEGKIMINHNIPEEMYSLLELNNNYTLPNEYLSKERLNYLNKHMEIFNIINR